MSELQLTDFSHLNAIESRLAHERARVIEAKTEQERAWREHNVQMIERERVAELNFLGGPVTLDDISDDELLALLG